MHELNKSLETAGIDLHIRRGIMPHHRQPCSPAVTQESEPNFVRERGEEGGLKSDKSILEIGYISGSEHTGENLTETERSTKSTQTDIYI